MCELVVSFFKLHKTTAYSTYTYKLGDVHTIRRFRWNIRAWGKTYNVKVETVPFIVNRRGVFPIVNDNHYI